MALAEVETGVLKLDSLTEVSPSDVIEGDVTVNGDPVHWMLRRPAEETPGEVMVLLRGLGTTLQSYAAFSRAAARSGHTVLATSSARHGSDRRDPHSANLDTISAAIDAASKKAGDSASFDNLLLMAHSHGGIPAIKLAESQPDNVRLIINAGAVGYHGLELGYITRNLPRGILLGLKHELWPAVADGSIEVSRKHLADFLHHNFKNPAQTLKELWSCMSHDLRPSAARLRAAGVLIGYIAFEHDSLVPPNPETASNVDVYRVMPDSGHMAPQRKSAELMAVVTNMRFALKGLGDSEP